MNLNLLYQYWKLKRHEKLSELDIKKIQWKRLKDILDHAYNNVPFYRKKFDDEGIKPSDIKTEEDLVRIPITTKEQLVSAGTDIFAEGYSPKNCFSSKTSGSTGEPFSSYFDSKAWDILKFASKLRARRACGLAVGARIINIEACSAEEANELNKKAKKSPADLFLKKRFLSVYDKIENHIKFYNSFKPDALYSFGTYFSELIDFAKENKIEWHKPKLIFTSSEILDPLTRKKIEDYFGPNVYDIYGTTEVKEVAWQCTSKSAYHINDDLYYVEINNNGSYPENIGEIVITTLVNKAMPLIRYSVKDLGCLEKGSCSCGLNFSLIKPVYGRYVDTFSLEDGRKVSPYQLTMSVEQVPGILQYQIVQKSKKDVLVKIKPDKGWNKESELKIDQELKNALDPNVKIEVRLTGNIEREPNGKFKVVKSEISQ
ncbi:hypothetical protein KKF04_03180 [Patescibacteria group bacterium]|nr:hypothetical protein [Patescibacteria group bacterium]